MFSTGRIKERRTSFEPENTVGGGGETRNSRELCISDRTLTSKGVATVVRGSRRAALSGRSSSSLLVFAGTDESATVGDALVSLAGPGTSNVVSVSSYNFAGYWALCVELTDMHEYHLSRSLTWATAVGARTTTFNVPTNFAPTATPLLHNLEDTGWGWVVCVIGDVDSRSLSRLTSALAEIALASNKGEEVEIRAVTRVSDECPPRCVEAVLSLPGVDAPARLRTACLQLSRASANVDFAFQPLATRMVSKRLVVFDVNFTLIKGDLILELAREWGVAAEVSAVTSRFNSGEISYDEAFATKVSLLRGMPVERVKAVVTRQELTEDARIVCATLRNARVKVALISSSAFRWASEHFRRTLGVDYAFGTTLNVCDGALTGEVRGAVVNADRKLEILEAILQAEGLSHNQVAVVGNGLTTSKIMAKAGLGIAFDAQEQDAEGLAIKRASLLHCLYVLGYNMDDIRAGASLEKKMRHKRTVLAQIAPDDKLGLHGDDTAPSSAAVSPSAEVSSPNGAAHGHQTPLQSMFTPSPSSPAMAVHPSGLVSEPSTSSSGSSPDSDCDLRVGKSSSSSSSAALPGSFAIITVLLEAGASALRATHAVFAATTDHGGSVWDLCYRSVPTSGLLRVLVSAADHATLVSLLKDVLYGVMVVSGANSPHVDVQHIDKESMGPVDRVISSRTLLDPCGDRPDSPAVVQAANPQGLDPVVARAIRAGDAAVAAAAGVAGPSDVGRGRGGARRRFASGATMASVKAKKRGVRTEVTFTCVIDAPERGLAVLATLSEIVADSGGKVLTARSFLSQPLCVRLKCDLTRASPEWYVRVMATGMLHGCGIAVNPLVRGRSLAPRVAFFEVGGTLLYNDYVKDLFRVAGVPEETAVSPYGNHIQAIAEALTGRPADTLDPVLSNFTYRKGVRELLRSLKRVGVRTVIVSSGLSIVATRVKNDLDMDEIFANRLCTDPKTGAFTGELAGERVAQVDKSNIMLAYLQQHKIEVSEAAAVGNGLLFADMCTASSHNIAVADETGTASYAGQPTVSLGPGSTNGWINGYVQTGRSMVHIAHMLGYTCHESLPVMPIDNFFR